MLLISLMVNNKHLTDEIQVDKLSRDLLHFCSQTLTEGSRRFIWKWLLLETVVLFFPVVQVVAVYVREMTKVYGDTLGDGFLTVM